MRESERHGLPLTFEDIHTMQSLTVAKPIGIITPARSRNGRHTLLIVAAKKISRNGSGPAGFVEEDNSGRSNIFAVEPKSLYVSSPRADKAAQQGLGGSQGLLVVGGLIAIVLLVTLGVARTGGEDLGQLQQSATSLREIASQF